MHSSNKINLQNLVLIGVLSALVFVLSTISFPVQIMPDANTRIHFGNIMCLVSGVLFGPLVGALSSGIGSMLYDFTNPLYISEFWITFLTKASMGFVAGWLAFYPLKNWKAVPRALVAGLGGQATYILLYLIKTFLMQKYVLGIPTEAIWVVVAGKGLVSTINGVLAVLCCTLIAPVLQGRLAAAGLFKNGHSAH